MPPVTSQKLLLEPLPKLLLASVIAADHPFQRIILVVLANHVAEATTAATPRKLNCVPARNSSLGLMAITSSADAARQLAVVA